MSRLLKLAVAAALAALSIGVPCALHRQGRRELLARREAWEQQAGRLSVLLQENARLSNLVSQAEAAPPLTAPQLREVLRLRNERHWLAEQTNLLARLASDTSAQATREENVTPEPDDLAQERARLGLLASSLGISAQDANRFFDRVKQRQQELAPRLEELQKTATGSPEERQRLTRAAVVEGLNQLAVETMGDKGPALVQKLISGP